MKFLDAEFVQGFIRMANDGWEQGWHERNGGNLSYRVKPEEVEAVRENFQEKEWQPIGTTVPNLAGEYFLVTGSGKYFRNVILKPEDSICMIELDEKGENYRIVWGLVGRFDNMSYVLVTMLVIVCRPYGCIVWRHCFQCAVLECKCDCARTFCRSHTPP